MPFFKVNYHDGSGDGSSPESRDLISGFNNVGSPGTTGVRVSDLLDTAGASTGFTLTHPSAFGGSVGFSSNAVSSPDPDFPQEFFDSAFYVDVGADVEISGLPVGATYTIKTSGVSGGTRDTQYSATDGDGPVTYVTNGETDPVPEPVSITGTVPANGIVALSITEVDTFAYSNGFSMDVQTAATPTITDINTNNEVVPGTTATLTGTNLTGATGFNIGSEAQTDFTVASDTSITFTTVRGGNPYNQDLTGTLLHPDGDQTITVQQVPEAGTFAVTAASPNTTDDASLWTGLVDTATSNPITIVDGDQAWVKNPNNLTNLAIAPDGTITADQEGDFVVQIWLASEGVWGSDQTVSFAVPEEADNWPFGKEITPSIPVTWTWGRRHPKTNMRVRIYK